MAKFSDHDLDVLLDIFPKLIAGVQYEQARRRKRKEKLIRKRANKMGYHVRVRANGNYELCDKLDRRRVEPDMGLDELVEFLE